MWDDANRSTYAHGRLLAPSYAHGIYLLKLCPRCISQSLRTVVCCFPNYAAAPICTIPRCAGAPRLPWWARVEADEPQTVKEKEEGLSTVK